MSLFTFSMPRINRTLSNFPEQKSMRIQIVLLSETYISTWFRKLYYNISTSTVFFIHLQQFSFTNPLTFRKSMFFEEPKAILRPPPNAREHELSIAQLNSFSRCFILSRSLDFRRGGGHHIGSRQYGQLAIRCSVSRGFASLPDRGHTPAALPLCFLPRRYCSLKILGWRLCGREED